MRTKTRKGLVAGIVALALVTVLLAGLTLAYLTDQRNTLNVLNLSNVKIALKEKEFAAQAELKDENAVITAYDEDTGDEYTLVTMNNVMPGEPINKDAVVQNLSPESVYIRVQLQDADGDPIDLTAAPYTNLNAQLNTNWEASNDGYIYYKLAVAANAEVPLFATQNTTAAMEDYPIGSPYTLMINPTLSNTDFDNDDAQKLSKAINMNVIAQAIQARGTIVDFSAVATTPPWPGNAVVTAAPRP